MHKFILHTSQKFEKYFDAFMITAMIIALYITFKATKMTKFI